MKTGSGKRTRLGITETSQLVTMHLLNMRDLVILVFSLYATQVKSQIDNHCLNDVNACTPQMRARLIDNNYYWFGTPYFTHCPSGAFCFNFRPDLQSIMARILVTNNSATLQSSVASTQILNVTFEHPATSYFACDTLIQIPAAAPLTLDPLKPAMISQFLVRTRPHVTWTPRTSQSLYTFIAYDTSFFILHGFLANCPGGSLDGCDDIDPWHGTGNGIPINSPYSFLIYEQTSRIPTDEAKQAETETQNEGRFGTSSPLGAFYIATLLQKLSFYYYPELKFASIMEMYADPYGSFQFTNFFSSGDLCPYYYSQKPEFEWAVKSMEIPNLKWSSPAYGYSQTAVAPHLTSITVNVHITYNSEDLMDTACCEHFRITRGTHLVSALDSNPVGAAMTRKAPQVFLSPVVIFGADGGRSIIGFTPYTLVMLDVTPVGNYITGVGNLAVHWLVTNIYESNFYTGTEVLPYTPPTPTDENRPLTFMFLLFAQTGRVNPRSIDQLCPFGTTTCQLRVTDLIANWNLGDIKGVNWFQSKEDGYSIKRQYTEMGRSEINVCSGKTGYASPCPAQQPCSAIGQLGFRQPHLIGLLPATVLMLYFLRA